MSFDTAVAVPGVWHGNHWIMKYADHADGQLNVTESPRLFRRLVCLSQAATAGSACWR